MATKRKGMPMPRDDSRAAEIMGEVRGMLGSFIARFETHEVQDREIAKGTDARLERIETRAEDRSVKQTLAFETKLEQVVEKIDTRLNEFATKLDTVSSRQTFSAGGWRYISIAATAVIGLVTSVVSIIIELSNRGGGH